MGKKNEEKPPQADHSKRPAFTVRRASKIGWFIRHFRDGFMETAIQLAEISQVITSVWKSRQSDAAYQKRGNPFSAANLNIVRWAKLIVPSAVYQSVIEPMVADREAEIRDLQVTNEKALLNLRVFQLHVDLTRLCLRYLIKGKP